jgi:hypothetical protein
MVCRFRSSGNSTSILVVITRAIRLEDVDQLKIIHEKFYKDEFEFPDFFNKFVSSFVVTDDENNIISGGGVRTIIESIILTNKNCSVADRREALYEMLRVSAGTIKLNGYHELHAFIQDEVWMNHLKRAGFVETVGKSLVLSL